MKPVFVRSVLLFFFLCLLAVSHTLAADSPWELKLPFQNATITYDITGMETGSETLYIKKYGSYRALHHEGTTSMLGITSISRRMELTDPDYHYTFDLEEKTGTKVTNPKKIYQEQYNRLSPAEQKNVRHNAELLGISMVNDFQGETIAKATTILGYECDRTTIMGMTVHVIHKTDVPLHTEMNVLGIKVKIVATSVNTDPPPAEVFVAPAGIAPVLDREAEEVSRAMITKVINTLKEPDGADKMRTHTTGVEQENPAAPHHPSKETGSGPQGQEGQLQEEPDQDIRQGIDMIKGLFGN